MSDILAPDNRLIPRIAHARDCLARRVRLDNGEPLPASLDLAQFERNLDNSLAEFFYFQNLQSEAHALGVISTSEAMTVYTSLGEAPGSDGWAEGTDIATKLIVTEFMKELIVIVRRNR